MTRDEKWLYVQIHPLRLAAGVAGAGWGLPLLWSHRPLPGLALTFAPPALAAVGLSSSAQLHGVRASGWGRYARRYLTPPAQAARAAAWVAILGAAWSHRPVLLGAGLLALGGVWARGWAVDRTWRRIPVASLARS
jgi:hypothetical protein